MWGLLNNGTTQALNLVIGIFLARLLSPQDYGIVGVLAIFTTLASNLQSFGFAQAIVNMKSPEKRDYNAVFWFNILVSFAVYIILFFLAPLLAAYFRQEELIPLSRVVFLAFVASAFGIAPGAYMLKNLMVKEATIIGVVSLIVSGLTGIFLAWNGMAYWSLAWQQIIYIALVTLGRYLYTPWRPSFKIDFTPIKGMFSFSVKIFLTMVINTLSLNILTFIFGRFFPMRVVGNFTQANKWNTMAYSFLTGTVQQVAQPVLAQITEDKDREKRVFRKMMRFTAFLTFPAMLGLLMVANEFIIITISDKWINSVPLLQILVLGGAFIPLHTLYQNLVISHGRSDLYLKCNSMLILLEVVLALLLASYGIKTMVTAYTALNIIFFFVWQGISRHLIGLTFIEVIKDTFPFLLASLLVMTLVYFITIWIGNLVLLLLVRIILAAIFYFLIMKISKARILEESIEYFKKRFSK